MGSVAEPPGPPGLAGGSLDPEMLVEHWLEHVGSQRHEALEGLQRTRPVLCHHERLDEAPRGVARAEVRQPRNHLQLPGAICRHGLAESDSTADHALDELRGHRGVGVVHDPRALSEEPSVGLDVSPTRGQDQGEVGQADSLGSSSLEDVAALLLGVEAGVERHDTAPLAGKVDGDLLADAASSAEEAQGRPRRVDACLLGSVRDARQHGEARPECSVDHVVARLVARSVVPGRKPASECDAASACEETLHLLDVVGRELVVSVKLVLAERRGNDEPPSNRCLQDADREHGEKSTQDAVEPTGPVGALVTLGAVDREDRAGQVADDGSQHEPQRQEDRHEDELPNSTCDPTLQAPSLVLATERARVQVLDGDVHPRHGRDGLPHGRLWTDLVRRRRLHPTGRRTRLPAVCRGTLRPLLGGGIPVGLHDHGVLLAQMGSNIAVDVGRNVVPPEETGLCLDNFLRKKQIEDPITSFASRQLCD